MTAGRSALPGLLSTSGEGAIRRRHLSAHSSCGLGLGDAMKSAVKGPPAKSRPAKSQPTKSHAAKALAERMLARFGAMAALILIGAVVFYGR